MIQHTHRFHGRSSLRFVYQRGQVVRGMMLSLRYVSNPRRQAYRTAVVVSRKVSKSAVVRNRIRRRIYEIVRAHGGQISGPFDLVFTVYDEALASQESETLKRAIVHQLQKAGVLHLGSSAVTDHAIVENKEKTA